MKKSLWVLFTLISLFALSGCDRRKFAMGNIEAPGVGEAPAYTAELNTEPVVKTP